MLKSYFLHLAFLFLLPHFMIAQRDSIHQNTSNINSINFDSTNYGSYTLRLPSGLDELIESYKKVNYTSEGIDGFRVQIFSESGNTAKEQAQKHQSEFNQSSSEAISYLIYQQPNFKVRCGDFRTKAEARRLLKQLSGQYPGAYIVKDIIKYPN